MRPVRLRAAVVLLGVSFAIFGIARTTGAGWLVVILSGLAAIALASAIWPAFALRGVRVEASGPRDATAGRSLAMRVGVVGGRSGLQVRLTAPPSEWFAADPPAEGPVAVVPRRRGVVERVRVEVRSAAPLGLVWWRRTFDLALPTPVEVGPEPVPVPLPLTTPAGTIGESRTRGRSGSDTVRSLRDYVPGDPIRLVNWKATARHGDLMVKELEGPDSPRLAVVADLRPADSTSWDSEAGLDEADEAAARAAGLVRAAIQAGIPVLLATLEADGARVGLVSSPTDLNRRLARAVAGPPPDPGADAGMTVVRITTHSRARAEAVA